MVKTFYLCKIVDNVECTQIQLSSKETYHCKILSYNQCRLRWMVEVVGWKSIWINKG